MATRATPQAEAEEPAGELAGEPGEELAVVEAEVEGEEPEVMGSDEVVNSRDKLGNRGFLTVKKPSC